MIVGCLEENFVCLERREHNVYFVGYELALKLLLKITLHALCIFHCKIS